MVISLHLLDFQTNVLLISKWIKDQKVPESLFKDYQLIQSFEIVVIEILAPWKHNQQVIQFEAKEK